MKNKAITFSFGKNWKHFQKSIDATSIKLALNDIDLWIGRDKIKNSTILDIGSGSGLMSYCYFMLGARKIVSFDFDSFSVDATRKLWIQSSKPDNWEIFEGSILDMRFLDNFDKFDIVSSWGVLHHTGKMWEAINNALSLVDVNGLFWISIYQGVSTYQQDLALKNKYNEAFWLGKKIMVIREIYNLMKLQFESGLNPLKWNKKRGRGMTVYNDIVDWFGGLPYEVASKEEIINYCLNLGLKLMKLNDKEACIVYLFKRV